MEERLPHTICFEVCVLHESTSLSHAPRAIDFEGCGKGIV